MRSVERSVTTRAAIAYVLSLPLSPGVARRLGADVATKAKVCATAQAVIAAVRD
jgi:hypothetical protein